VSTRIGHAKARAGGIAPLRISFSRSRWVSIENGGENRELIVGRNLQPDARCGQRISGPAAREINRRDGRPTKRRVDKKTTVLAYKKLLSGRNLRRELTRPDGDHATGKLLFDPKVKEARRGQGLFRDNVRSIERACRITKVERMEHLIAFRETLIEYRDPANGKRDDRRMNGNDGPGPLTISARRELLGRLLKLQEDTGLNLITEEELFLVLHCFQWNSIRSRKLR